MSAIRDTGYATPLRPPPRGEKTFSLADFPTRWQHAARYDLSASECQTPGLAELLAMARPADLERWQKLGLGYADPRGAIWLRETISTRYAGLDADDILCCAGAQEALACLVQALLTPEDHAVVVLPVYPPAERVVAARAATTGVMLQERAGRWRLDIGAIEAALRPNTRMVLINFPNSPTGATIEADSLATLVDLCRKHGLWLVNDEVYRLTALHAEKLPPPAAQLYERGVSINAVSKGLGLPGLRVGWIACPDRPVLARAQQAKSLASACLGAPCEVLAEIALANEARIVTRNRAIGLANRTSLHGFLGRHPTLFAPTYPENLAFAFPRFLGHEGAEGHADSLASGLGLLVLPSSLWRSPLGQAPVDHLRIGLGRTGFDAALAAWEAHLAS
jgi:aspartate/methionine/tyrosine aminotransferase